MVTREQIDELAARIAEKYRPEKIILFGSHARGEAREDSDVDLLVVMPFEGSPARLRGRIRMDLPLTIAFDLLVKTPQGMARRIDLSDPFILEILKNGRVLYEAAHA